MKKLHILCIKCFIFFFKQKTAYEMRISDWSSDVCSSDLLSPHSARLYDFQVETLFSGAAQTMRRQALAPLARFFAGRGLRDARQLGRESCRVRVCQFV